MLRCATVQEICMQIGATSGEDAENSISTPQTPCREFVARSAIALIECEIRQKSRSWCSANSIFAGCCEKGTWTHLLAETAVGASESFQLGICNSTSSWQQQLLLTRRGEKRGRWTVI